jgi:energy-coupling factor transporter transmembrane protein EcfT
MFPMSANLHYFFLAFSLAILIISRKYKRCLKFAVAYLILFIVNYLAFNVDNPLTQFIAASLLIYIQFMPCLIMATVLICDYTSTELVSSLELLHLPKPFVVAIAITIRYIPTFRKEFKYIKESMRLRGISYTWRNPIRSFEYFLVPQLFRCANLSDEITAAGLSKGITNPISRTSYYDIRLRRYDYCLLVVLVVGTIGVILWH